MKKNLSTDVKVGLFILLALAIIAYVTIDVSDDTLSTGRTYTIHAVLDSAAGINKKTPVKIAGIKVGAVRDISLVENNQARITLQIDEKVKLTEDMQLRVKSQGFLGDSYLELTPGKESGKLMAPGYTITHTQLPSSYQDLFQNANEVTKDLKEITQAIKIYTVSDQSRVAKILENMEVLTKHLADFSVRNAQNMDAVVENLAALTSDLRGMSDRSSPRVEAALRRIDEITEKINSGEGTVGRLINDEQTIDKANRVLDNISDITDTIFSMKTEFDYHLEYLGDPDLNTFKNYFSVRFQPRPDKFFLLGIAHNPKPTTSTSTSTETITTDTGTTVIERETEKEENLKFTAQIGKQFKNVTVRGGLIESAGGFGIDYAIGPANLKTDVFNFGEGGPQVKATAELNITPSFYLLGGIDDITGQRTGRTWFVGAGLRFTDRDALSLLGGAGLVLSQ